MLLFVAMTGHHSSGGQFGEAADAGLGVGRHRAAPWGEPTPARPHTRPSTMIGTPTAACTPTACTRACIGPATVS